MYALLPTKFDIFSSGYKTCNTNKRDIRRKSMSTIRLGQRKWDVEKVMITAGMFIMESFGTVMLLCGILDIKIL